MAKIKIPVTPVTRLLKQSKTDFTPHLYDYEERGGTAVSARELGVAEARIIKTLVMADEQGKALIVLMHGDQEVSTKELARTIGVKSITPCTAEVALKHTGYMVGGTSPFATKKPMPVYIEETITSLPRIYINGGKRGFLISMPPQSLVDVLQPIRVTVGIKKT